MVSRIRHVLYTSQKKYGKWCLTFGATMTTKATKYSLLPFIAKSRSWEPAIVPKPIENPCYRENAFVFANKYIQQKKGGVNIYSPLFTKGERLTLRERWIKPPFFMSITTFILEERCWLLVVCSGCPFWDYPVREACFMGTSVDLAHDHAHHKPVGVHQSTQPFPLCLWVLFAREQSCMGEWHPAP